MAKAVLIRQGKAGAGWHPWVFRSDIAQVSGTYEPGDVLDVVSSRADFLGGRFTTQIADFPADDDPA